MASRKNRSRKSLAVALAIVGVAGLSMASAAQLNVTSDTVAAGVDTITACDADGVTVTYGTTFSGGVYEVSSVTIAGVDDTNCDGRTLDFTLLDVTDAAIGSGTATIASGTTSYTIGSLTTSAEALTGIAVVIH